MNYCACIYNCSLFLSGTITKNVMQDGALPHLALPVHTSIGNDFTGRWIGRGGPNDLRESPILFNMIYVGGVGSNRQSARPNQEHMTELD